jgi:hypothetical protein
MVSSPLGEGINIPSTSSVHEYPVEAQKNTNTITNTQTNDLIIQEHPDDYTVHALKANLNLINSVVLTDLLLDLYAYKIARLRFLRGNTIDLHRGHILREIGCAAFYVYPVSHYQCAG